MKLLFPAKYNAIRNKSEATDTLDRIILQITIQLPCDRGHGPQQTNTYNYLINGNYPPAICHNSFVCSSFPCQVVNIQTAMFCLRISIHILHNTHTHTHIHTKL
jgi:hypothetical protein